MSRIAYHTAPQRTMTSFPTLRGEAIAFCSSLPIHGEERLTLKWGCLIIEAGNGRTRDQLILLNDMTVCGEPNSQTLTLSHREHGDIRLTFKNSGEAGIWLTALGKCTGWLLGDLYTDIGYLDSGGNGDVYSATQRETGIRVAVKVFKNDPERNMRELAYSWELRHKNLMCAVDILLAREYAVLVLPLMNAGDLLEHILKHPNGMPEDKARGIYRQILSGVANMHDQRIVHRDLKPQNIFCAHNADGTLVAKVGDFGTAAFLSSGELFEPKPEVTSYLYAAPEQARMLPYDMKADMFSLGVILFNLLTNRTCFNGQRREEIYSKISRGKRASVDLSRLSPEARELLDKLLEMNPANRIDIRDALNHPWLAQQ